MFGVAQYLVMWAVTLLVFVLAGFALVDAATRKAELFAAAGKLTKGKWLAINGLALALTFLGLPGGPLGPFNILMIVSAVAASVYLVDVRPALQRLSGRGGRPGNSYGPYGPW
ncbi:MAG: DUF2516 family protein [Kineosporiaceae bacterium]